MATKSLLQIIQAVTGELNLSVPQTVLSNTTKTVVQLKALTIAACDELLEMEDWQQLLNIHSFNTVAATATYELPSDYVRYVSNTGWDTTNNFPISGHENPQNWAVLSNGFNVSGPYTRYRVVGDLIELLPVPTGISTINLDYISSKYVVDGVTSAKKLEFTLDADTTLFNYRLVINFVKLKFWQIKGFDTSAAVQDFNNSLEVARGTNVPAPNLILSGRYSDGLLSIFNTPDSIQA